MPGTPRRRRRPDAQPGGPLLAAIVALAALVAIAGLVSVRADGATDALRPAASPSR